MAFLERILDGLGSEPRIRDASGTTTGSDLARLVASARGHLRQNGVKPGDRVALVGENSARWIALDLAILAEGALCVPLYTRETEEDRARAISDCTPRLVLRAPFEGVFDAAEVTAPGPPRDAIRIVYTSGTSGAPKGAVLTAAGVEFMLERTGERLDRLLSGVAPPERIFHYLPFCFAGSWILLLSALLRKSLLVLATDLGRLPEEMVAADPHTVLHVPLVLDRLRAGLLHRLGRNPLWRVPFLRGPVFGRAVRRRLAPSLRAFICGSAPLSEETQRFLMMLGLPVLQVYGLTETTAICTMDEPGRAVAGRVGPAIDGVEMRRSPEGEIFVRGPNLFRGYWGRAPHEGWFATGDLGDVDAEGRWRIAGRRKEVVVLASGHNVSPEPIERLLADAGAGDAVVLGQGRPFLVAILFGGSPEPIAAVNSQLPHYERIRAHYRHPRPLAEEPGLLTANGKVRRAAVRERFAKEVEGLYT